MGHIIHLETEIGWNTCSKLRDTCVSFDVVGNSLENSCSRLTSAWSGGGADEFTNEFHSLINRYHSSINALDLLIQRMQREINEWEEADRSFSNIRTLTPSPGFLPPGTNLNIEITINDILETEDFDWMAAYDGFVNGIPLDSFIGLSLLTGILSDVTSGEAVDQAYISEITEVLAAYAVALIPIVGAPVTIVMESYDAILGIGHVVSMIYEISGQHALAVGLQNTLEAFDINEMASDAVYSALVSIYEEAQKVMMDLGITMNTISGGSGGGSW